MCPPNFTFRFMNIVLINSRLQKEAVVQFYVGLCNTVSSTSTYLEPVFLGAEVNTHFVKIVS